MKKTLTIAALVALPLGLTGCDKKVEAPKAEASADAMGDMAMPTAVKHGNGIGTVTAIDPAKGTITLDHGEVAELQWPAMKMGFTVATSATSDLRELLTSENTALPTPNLQTRPAPPPKWNVFERAAYDRETQILAENERSSI